MKIVAHEDGYDEELRIDLAEYLLAIDILTPDDIFSRVPLTREKQVPLDLMALLLNRI